MEIWKELKGYEGLYEISNFGKVRSIERIDDRGRKLKSKTLATRTNNMGYEYISLNSSGIRKTYRLHRLVAMTFIENPNKFSEVNHKDENKLNNKADNLEWCSRIYNANYGTLKARSVEKRKGKGKKVIQYTIDGILLKEFNTLLEASKSVSGKATNISACCKGKYKTSYGYKWKFA